MLKQTKLQSKAEFQNLFVFQLVYLRPRFENGMEDCGIKLSFFFSFFIFSLFLSCVGEYTLNITTCWNEAG